MPDPKFDGPCQHDDLIHDVMRRDAGGVFDGVEKLYGFVLHITTTCRDCGMKFIPCNLPIYQGSEESSPCEPMLMPDMHTLGYPLLPATAWSGGFKVVRENKRGQRVFVPIQEN